MIMVTRRNLATWQSLLMLVQFFVLMLPLLIHCIPSDSNRNENIASELATSSASATAASCGKKYPQTKVRRQCGMAKIVRPCSRAEQKRQRIEGHMKACYRKRLKCRLYLIFGKKYRIRWMSSNRKKPRVFGISKSAWRKYTFAIWKKKLFARRRRCRMISRRRRRCAYGKWRAVFHANGKLVLARTTAAAFSCNRSYGSVSQVRTKCKGDTCQTSFSLGPLIWRMRRVMKKKKSAGLFELRFFLRVDSKKKLVKILDGKMYASDKRRWYKNSRKSAAHAIGHEKGKKQLREKRNKHRGRRHHRRKHHHGHRYNRKRKRNYAKHDGKQYHKHNHGRRQNKDYKSNYVRRQDKHRKGNYGRRQNEDYKGNHGRRQDKDHKGNYGRRQNKDRKGNYGRRQNKDRKGNYGRRQDKDRKGNYGRRKNKYHKGSYDRRQNEDYKGNYVRRKNKDYKGDYGRRQNKDYKGDYDRSQNENREGNYGGRRSENEQEYDQRHRHGRRHHHDRNNERHHRDEDYNNEQEQSQNNEFDADNVKRQIVHEPEKPQRTVINPRLKIAEMEAKRRAGVRQEGHAYDAVNKDPHLFNIIPNNKQQENQQEEQQSRQEQPEKDRQQTPAQRQEQHQRRDWQENREQEQGNEVEGRIVHEDLRNQRVWNSLVLKDGKITHQDPINDEGGDW